MPSIKLVQLNIDLGEGIKHSMLYLKKQTDLTSLYRHSQYRLI